MLSLGYFLNPFVCYCVAWLIFANPLKSNDVDRTEKTPKGVVLVMIDDIGYGDIDFFSPSDLQTPSIDQLCRESLRLVDFHVGTTCSPTRASLMTGRHINATGVWHTIAGRSILRENEQTMGDVFLANGWKTGVFGKWHLGEGYPFAPRFRGFETSVIHGGGGVGQQPDYWRNDYYAARSATKNFDGNSTSNDHYFQNGKIVEADEFCTDYWFTQAIKFMKQSLDEQKPFFCYIPTNAAHGPFNAPPGGKKGFDGLIENVDFNMNRLDEFLKSEGVVDDVLLIFMTDNGTAGQSRLGGLRGIKGSHYDGGHNVPCCCRWKNGGIGGTRDAARDVLPLTTAADWLPTFIDLFELKKPDGGQPVHGITLKEMLVNTNPKPTSRTWVVDTQRTRDLVKWKNLCVMKDEVVDNRIVHKWRLTRQNKDSEFEIYDLAADRAQTKNVIAENPDLASELESVYEIWWQDIDSQTRDYPASVIGMEPETVLYSHDWINQDGSPWHQNSVRNAGKGSRTRSIRFAKSGKYQVELRRWPREDGGAIDGTDSQGVGVALAVTKAELVIDGVGEWSKAIESGGAVVAFKMDVEAGDDTTLSTSFLNEDNEILAGAYYVYIRQVDN